MDRQVEGSRDEITGEITARRVIARLNGTITGFNTASRRPHCITQRRAPRRIRDVAGVAGIYRDR